MSEGPWFPASAAELRAWLEAHYADTAELRLGLVKKGATQPGVTYREAVDEALCFGWIDGVARSIDDTTWTVRFTPRRKGSNWSARNVQRVDELTAEGRMRRPGLDAFSLRGP